MRLTPVLAGVATAFVAASGTGARSDEPSSSPPPTFNLWNRPGIWKTTMAKKPIQFGDIVFGETGGILDGGYQPEGFTSVFLFNGLSTGSGKAAKGLFGFPIGPSDSYTPGSGRFAIKMTDTARYEQFKGTAFFFGSHGVPFSGTYQPGPVEEETGSANLRLLLFATKPKGHLGTSKVKSIRRKDLPAKVAFVGVVQNTGPDLLPRGVAKMQFTTVPGKSQGLTLPLIWRTERIVDPVSYHVGDALGDTWVQEATMGALGSKKDRAAFGFEVDIPANFSETNVRVFMNVVSNAPGFTLTTKDAAAGSTLERPTWIVEIVDSEPL